MNNFQWLKIWAFALFIVASAAIVGSPPDATDAATIIESVQLTANDFYSGDGLQYQITPAGLTMEAGAMTAVYLSPPIDAPIPYNVLVPQWRSDLPESTSLDLLVRTRQAAGEWGEWHHLDSHADLNDEETASANWRYDRRAGQ